MLYYKSPAFLFLLGYEDTRLKTCLLILIITGPSGRVVSGVGRRRLARLLQSWA
jgi:hypothetical protein